MVGYGAGYADGRSCCYCSITSSSSSSIPRRLLCSSYQCFRLSSLRLCAGATWQEAASASFIHVSCSWEHRESKSQEYRQGASPWSDSTSVTTCSAIIKYDARAQEVDDPVSSFRLHSPELLLFPPLDLPSLATNVESTECRSEADTSISNGTIICENTSTGKLASVSDACDFVPHSCSEEESSKRVAKEPSKEYLDSGFVTAPSCIDARSVDDSSRQSSVDPMGEDDLFAPATASVDTEDVRSADEPRGLNQPYDGPFSAVRKRYLNGEVHNDMDEKEIKRSNPLQLLEHDRRAFTVQSKGGTFPYYSGWETLSIEDALERMEKVYSAEDYLENCICLLQKCKQNKALAAAMLVYTWLCNNGLEGHALLSSYLIAMFVECGSLRMAQMVFNKASFRNEYSWTYLIQGYIGGGDPEHSLNVFFGMIGAGINPGKYTYVAVLAGCARLRCIERGCQIHAEIVKEGFDKELLVARSLVDFYAKCGLFEEAKVLFDELPHHHSQARTSGYPSIVAPESDEASVEDMQREGLSAAVVGYIYSLKACGSMKDLRRGHELHMGTVKAGLEVYTTVCNTLIDMYAKCGSISEAFKVLRRMPRRDVVSWTALIMGCIECGLASDALLCLDKMQEENVCPNAFTYVCCLKACGMMKALETGRGLHMQITKEGCYTDLVVCNAIVDMYAKCGSLEEARNVFDGLVIRDIIGWTSLIAGYADHGTCEEVVGCFEEMQTEGVVPNSLTFVCCLKACANMRDSHMGQRLHSDLVVEGFEDYNFVGNALLSMYARCGMYSEAREVLYHLQSRDVISWTTLISEYAEDGLGEDALNVFNEMCEEGVPPNSVTYMCCLKACGSIGALTKGKRLHIDITKRGLETNPFICNALVDMYAECGKPLELDL